jgi:hypothetical protein
MAFSKATVMDPISPDAEDTQAITEPTKVKSEETPKIEVVKKPRSEAQKAALEKARHNATAARAEKAAAKKMLKEPEPEPEPEPEEEIEYVRKKKPIKRRIVVVEASSDEEEEEIEVRLPKKRQPAASDSVKNVADPRLDASMHKMFGAL